MLTLDRITQRADQDDVDADVVERDYVLTHVIGSLALHRDNTLVQFKGGTALRLCHFADYRYSADIDLNRDPSASDEQVQQLLEEVLTMTRDRIGLPALRLK
jgi:predicted nucleotidyltransferase component of viral defense system